MADDHKIYRVDTTDAFPISNYQLDFAGINQEMGGYIPYNVIKEQLLSANFSGILDGEYFKRYIFELQGQCWTD